MPLPRRKPKSVKPSLPNGLFVFVLNHEQPNSEVDPIQDIDGPFDSQRVVHEPDGTVVFLTEGLPYPVRIARQEGNLIWFEDSKRPVRLEAWPLS